MTTPTHSRKRGTGKHRITKIRNGRYNYRGYFIRRRLDLWVVFNDVEDIAWRSRTLRGMRNEIDRHELIVRGDLILP